MAIVSFFFPIVGWIYGAAKKHEEPEKAAKCARLASIGFGLGLLIQLIG